MLNIDIKKDGANLDAALEGRLDTTTAPDLEKQINENIDGVTKLTYDFSKLTYISSAGLRVLLANQKVMNKQGSMIVKNVSEEIMGIFEVTGFSNILTIQ